MITKITARYVIGFDGTDHLIYKNGEVLYENDTVIGVGPVSAAFADRTIQAGNAIVSPGFIDLDALWDIDHCIFDSWPDPEQGKGLEWSERYFDSERTPLFSSRRGALSPQVRHAASDHEWRNHRPADFWRVPQIVGRDL